MTTYIRDKSLPSIDLSNSKHGRILLRSGLRMDVKSILNEENDTSRKMSKKPRIALLRK